MAHSHLHSHLESLSQANWASGLPPTPPHHLWIPPMKRSDETLKHLPMRGLECVHLSNELWWCMCDHLSIILGARGYSCKFSAPGHTITGPALTWSSHLCTVMPSPIVHWCPGQPGPRVTRNSEPGLNVWWMQSDELVSCDDQWGDSIRVPRPVRQVTIPVEVSQWKPW